MSSHSENGGNTGIDPKKCAILLIEFQNEFATEGGKIYGQVKENMEANGMLQNTVWLVNKMRQIGMKIFHAPMSFNIDGSDNPNKNLGVLHGCFSDNLYVRGTWNAQICDPLTPQPQDVVVVGKHGPSAFPNTDLEQNLKKFGIETVALAGFMANCCVESTMREACDKGFGVITLTDCVATTSMAGYNNSVEITYPFFSSRKTAKNFAAEILKSSDGVQTSVRYDGKIPISLQPKPAIRKGDRTFDGQIPRGGLGIDPTKCAILFIEFQNEFTTKGGKLHESVKENMEANGMLKKSSDLANQMRKSGIKIFHAPISFKPDGSDNPNPNLGILAGCNSGKLFLKDSWNAQICEVMTPYPQDVIVTGKHGLSAWIGTDLEEQLKLHGIETLALAGFMANCCVESTMRTATEKGFNVITLTDCVATTSMAGYRIAVEIIYPFFSTPMTAATFASNILEQAELTNDQDCNHVTTACDPMMDWDFRTIAGQKVYQVGPWFVDVRQSAIGEKILVRSGKHEFDRYLVFAEGSGLPKEFLEEAIYSKKMPSSETEITQPFGWLCHMTIVRLPEVIGGCLIYSPILGQNQTIQPIIAELTERQLLPVRIVIAPSPQHHLALLQYQEVFPEAFYICGKASGQMPPLTRKRRDLRFDGILSWDSKTNKSVLSAAILDQEGSGPMSNDQNHQKTWEILESNFDIIVVDDNRSGEIVLLHKTTKTLIISDLLYKSDPAMVGPGGTKHRYTDPEWFAQGQEELFYNRPHDNSNGLMPSYRTHPRMRTIDIPGTKQSLDLILSLNFNQVLACHTDPMTGVEAKSLLKRAYAWLYDKT